MESVHGSVDVVGPSMTQAPLACRGVCCAHSANDHGMHFKSIILKRYNNVILLSTYLVFASKALRRPSVIINEQKLCADLLWGFLLPKNLYI